jgi:hypothetical protein
VVNAGMGLTALTLTCLVSSLSSKDFLDRTLDEGDIALYLFSNIKSRDGLLEEVCAVSGL